MANDLKIFLLYIFNPKGLIEGFKEGFRKMIEPKALSMILIWLALASLFILPIPRNYYTTMILLITSFGIQLRIAYIGGDYRYWWKQKLAEKNRDGSEKDKKRMGI